MLIVPEQHVGTKVQRVSMLIVRLFRERRGHTIKRVLDNAVPWS
jgi:hypothetical protein